MTKKINKFDALAYAVAVLGQPHQTHKNRLGASHGSFYDWHSWGPPCGRWLVVEEWSDGDQITAGGPDTAVWVRGNDDGGLCPEYEEEARALIDAFVEAWRCQV